VARTVGRADGTLSSTRTFEDLLTPDIQSALLPLSSVNRSVAAYVLGSLSGSGRVPRARLGPATKIRTTESHLINTYW
jgi:hypothetical protein